MSSRDYILDQVRRNQPAASVLPEVPLFDRPLVSLPGAFATGLARMGGMVVDAMAGEDLDALLAQLFPSARVICSATPEVQGTRDIATVQHPSALEDVDVGVVRAAFGIAETGSVWLSERELVHNALAFLSQHLVVLLDPAAIVPNLHHAYARHEFQHARYAVLMTGPSATADIEGVLIRGAQGIRSFTVITRPAAA